MNDQEIIALYYARDEQAITETAKSYGRLCMQVSMNILDSKPDAEECVNDTYLKTWNRIPPVKPDSLGAFVCRIARNLSLKRHRDLHRARRNRDLTVSFEELADCIPMPDESKDALPALLTAFLEGQGEVDRVLFVGRYWYALAVSDLAERMDMTSNAVSLRLHRTREKLRVYLEERGYRV